MFIDGTHNTKISSVRRSGMILSGEALVKFRSSERSRRNFCYPIYKHVTP